MPFTPTNTLKDLRIFFNLHNQKEKESRLNYFLVKKWMGREYKKKRKNNPMALIYLSVDFFYSIYVIGKGKKGQRITKLKACFPAEQAQIKARPLEKLIEISYTDKGLLWDTKKKFILEFNAKQIDEFALHHQQARVLYVSNSSSKSQKSSYIPPMYQSSIITGQKHQLRTSGMYQDVTLPNEKINNGFKKKSEVQIMNQESNLSRPSKRLTTSPSKSEHLSEEDYDLEDSSYRFHPFAYNSNINRSTDFDLRNYDEDEHGGDEKQYTSVQGTRNLDFSSGGREIDEELLEELKAEMNLFKKKIENQQSDGTEEELSDEDEQ